MTGPIDLHGNPFRTYFKAGLEIHRFHTPAFRLVDFLARDLLSLLYRPGAYCITWIASMNIRMFLVLKDFFRVVKLSV
jgi:hypothetical protein